MAGLIVIMAVVAAAIAFPGLLPSGQEGTVQPILTMPGTTPVPMTLETRVVPGTAGPGPTETTPEEEETPAPAFTPTPCIPAGEPGFTVAVSPIEATAARGQTVTYRMVIDAQNCFSENVTMKLTASVLFPLSTTYDLGTQTPPYPKTFEYALTVPDSLFPGATVNGVLTSTGGGITRENQLTLHVT